ncbi:uncharacterized protein PRCAT00004664001 [Priceomyces carsonii]|uniref:uncharacterized protein n=1 Tax=Priceomyces carsonii TaxID=28549 RepID=UPI002ED7C62A|nr:unnamed protein product [Priceomyces carsonii]
MGKTITLLGCVLGLYVSFLSWSVLQERINTKPYGVNAITGEEDYFKAPLVVNIIQASLASLVGFLYSIVCHQGLPYTVFTKNEKGDSLKIFKWLFLISLTSSLSGPISYLSLKHVDYLAYLLAKSCKLIPVMFVHFVFYGTRFAKYKYIVAGSVTLGVLVFTLSQPRKSSETVFNDGNSLLGIFQLLLSMFLDGLTNATQDQLFKVQNSKDFKGKKVTGSTLMCLLNLFMVIMTLLYTLIFKYESEIIYSVEFVKRYPAVLIHIIEFTILGAMGQIFVFIILEKFDSLVLVITTVTRKMISMILSVFLFGHDLNLIQQFGVALVFGGIAYESLAKAEGKPKKSTKLKSQ